MNVNLTDPQSPRVTLSRRNLLTLLKMLDVKVGEPVLRRIVSPLDVEPRTILYVRAEEDEQHYASLDRQESVRGVMGIGPEHIRG